MMNDTKMYFSFSHKLSDTLSPGGGGGGVGGTQVQRGVTYFVEEGVFFFKTSPCPRFCKKKGTFCTPGAKYGG